MDPATRYVQQMLLRERGRRLHEGATANLPIPVPSAPVTLPAPNPVFAPPPMGVRPLPLSQPVAALPEGQNAIGMGLGAIGNALFGGGDPPAPPPPVMAPGGMRTIAPARPAPPTPAQLAAARMALPPEERAMRDRTIAMAQLNQLISGKGVGATAPIPIDPNAPIVSGGGNALSVLFGGNQATEAGSTPLPGPGLFGGILETLGVADIPRQARAGNVGERGIQALRGEDNPSFQAELTRVNEWIYADPARAEDVYQHGYTAYDSEGKAIAYFPGELEQPGAGGRAVWEASRKDLNPISRILGDLIIDPTTLLPFGKAAGTGADVVGTAMRQVPDATWGQRIGGSILSGGGKAVSGPSNLLDRMANAPVDIAVGLGKTGLGKLGVNAQVERTVNEAYERLQAAIKAREALPSREQMDIRSRMMGGEEVLALPAPAMITPDPNAGQMGTPVTPTEQAGLNVVRTAREGAPPQPLRLGQPAMITPDPRAVDETLQQRARDMAQAPPAPRPAPAVRELRVTRNGVWHASPEVRVRRVTEDGQTTFQTERWNGDTDSWDVQAGFEVRRGQERNKAQQLAKAAADDLAGGESFVGDLAPRPRLPQQQLLRPAENPADDVPPVPDAPPLPDPPKPATATQRRTAESLVGAQPTRTRRTGGALSAVDAMTRPARDAFWNEYRPVLDGWMEQIYRKYQDPRLKMAPKDRSRGLGISVVRHVVDRQIPILKKHDPNAVIPDHVYKNERNQPIKRRINWENPKNVIEHAVFGQGNGKDPLSTFKQIAKQLVRDGDTDLLWELVGARERYRAARNLEPDEAARVALDAIEQGSSGVPSSSSTGITATGLPFERARQNVDAVRNQIGVNDQQRVIAEGGTPKIPNQKRDVSELFGGIGTSDLDETALGNTIAANGKTIAQDFLDRERDLTRLQQLSRMSRHGKREAAELSALRKEWDAVLDGRDVTDLTRQEITDIASRRTVKVLEDSLKPAQEVDRSLGGRLKTGAGKALEGTTSFGRGATLYNPVTGTRYVVRQAIDNAVALAQSGNLDVLFGRNGALRNAREVIDTYRDIRRQNRGKTEIVERGIDQLQKDRGRVRSPKLSSAAIEQVERGGLLGEHSKRKFVRGLGRLVAVPEIRDLANAIDTFTREQLFQTRYRPGLIDAKEQLIERSWRIAQENQVKGVSRERIADAIHAIETPSGAISSSDVQAALRGLETAPGVRPGKVENWVRRSSSEWKDLDDALDASAMAEVNRVLFSYDETVTDELLRKGIVFHYWQTRSIPLYAQEFIRNPHIAAAYFRMMEKANTIAEDPNTPLAVKGFLKVMSSPGGWNIFANPDAFGPFYLSVREAVEMETGNGNDLENALNKIPFMLAPWAQAAVAIVSGAMGQPMTNTVDPSHTRNQRDLATTAFNWGRAHGFFGNREDTPMLTPIGEEGLGAVQNAVANFFRLGPDVPQPDPTRFTERTLNEVVAQEVKRANPNLTPDELQRRINDTLRDRTGPEWRAAMENFTNRELFRAGPGKLSPARITTRFGPDDERRAATRDIQYGEDGQPLVPLTPEQEEAQAVQRVTTAATQAGADLAIGQSQYNDLYNTPGGQAATVWNDIVHSENESVMVPVVWNANGSFRPAREGEQGTLFPAEVLAAATDDERRQFADIVMSANGWTSDLQTFRDEQDRLRTENPALANWKDFQTTARNHPGGVEAFAAEMAGMNPAYDAFYQDMLPLVQSGDRDADDLISRDAFLAATGEYGSIYDRTVGPPDVRDQDRIPAIPGMDGETGGGTGSGDEPKTQADFIRKDILRYEEALMYANALIGQQYPGVTYQQLEMANPMTARAVDSMLQREGFPVPYLAGDASTYYQWARQQPPGADASVEAFLAQRQKRRDAVLMGGS